MVPKRLGEGTRRCAMEGPDVAIDKVLADVAVDDFASALTFYERLLGRPADAAPMEGLAEWHLAEGGGDPSERRCGPCGIVHHDPRGEQPRRGARRAGGEGNTRRTDPRDAGVREGRHGNRPRRQPDHLRGRPHRQELKAHRIAASGSPGANDAQSEPSRAWETAYSLNWVERGILGSSPGKFHRSPIWGLHRSSRCCCIECNRSPQERGERSTRDAPPTDRTPNQR
jgi:hypothetical protein